MVIVTGGAGFIGSNVVRRLSDAGRDVLVIDDPDTPQVANIAATRITDLMSPAAFLSAVRDNDAVVRRSEGIIHLGACTSTTASDSDRVMESNVAVPVRLLDACTRTRRPFVYASSASVYGRSGRRIGGGGRERPLNLYARSKLRFDRIVSERGPTGSKVVGLRYFNVYGPGEEHKGDMSSVVRRFHDQALSDGEIRVFDAALGFGSGEHRRDFVHVDDVVAVTLWAFEEAAPSGVYDCGTGSSRTFNEVAGLVIDQVGAGKIRYVPMPPSFETAYQPDTRADRSDLRRAGYRSEFIPVEHGVPTYLAHRVRSLDANSPSGKTDHRRHQ